MLGSRCEGNRAHQQCLQGLVCAPWSCPKSSLWLVPTAGRERAEALQALLPVCTGSSSPGKRCQHGAAVT